MFLSVVLSAATVSQAQNFAEFDATRALSLDWWLQHLHDAYAQDPYHMITELFLIVFILWLVFKKDDRTEPSHFDELSHREKQKLVEEWTPEALVSGKLLAKSLKKTQTRRAPTVYVCGPPSPVTTDEDNKQYIHLSSQNYLGLANNEIIKGECQKTILKYAVGSCGPRGFYGSMDIHLLLEDALATFFGKPAIIYADYIGCPASVMTAFSKKNDLLVIDEGCHFLLVQGAILSRSNVQFYNHNNMAHLEACLQTVQESDTENNKALYRKFIVTEGVFNNYGDICRLKKLIELKNVYKYRLILDDTHALGTIHPKGSPGYFGIDMSEIDMYLSSMGASLGSTGGFCVGSKQIVHHQTLSGSGYVFSASAPPFSCTAAQWALKLITEHGAQYCRALQGNAQLMRQLLQDTQDPKRWTLRGNQLNNSHENQNGFGAHVVDDTISPLIHIRFDPSLDIDNASAQQYFEDASALCIENGVLVYATAYLPMEYTLPSRKAPEPSLRLTVTKDHTKEHLTAGAKIIRQMLDTVLKEKDRRKNNNESRELDEKINAQNDEAVENNNNNNNSGKPNSSLVVETDV